MKYIDIYNKFVLSGKLENHPTSCLNGGVCGALPRTKLREFCELFKPDYYDHAYWGYPYKFPERGSQDKAVYGFNPLRQNMILLMAAMNNEL